jgi:hypothetical protein
VNNIITSLLVLNSIFIITIVLNQNESAKDSLKIQSANFFDNPLENITWVALIFEFFLFLIEIKNNV